MMNAIYKLIHVYLFFAFTLGTLLEFERTTPLAISIAVFIAVMATVTYTRDVVISIYNDFILPNYWFILGVFGPLHFYCSVDNIYLCLAGVVIVCISALLELGYKLKGGDYSKWAL